MQPKTVPVWLIMLLSLPALTCQTITEAPVGEDVQRNGEATPPPVTLSAMETLIPVSAVVPPTVDYSVATSAQQIVGVWRAGETYVRFDRDGTFRQAHTLDQLDSQPFAINTYRFEGNKMVIEEISVSGVPSCGAKAGIYQVWLMDGGDLKVIAVDDPCRRVLDMQGEYEPVK